MERGTAAVADEKDRPTQSPAASVIVMAPRNNDVTAWFECPHAPPHAPMYSAASRKRLGISPLDIDTTGLLPVGITGRRPLDAPRCPVHHQWWFGAGGCHLGQQ